MRRNRERGFTLIELLVAAVIGVIMVLALGTLGLNSFHQRITADSLSAAATLAERQIERLKALPNPATNALLTAGTHTAAGSPLQGERHDRRPIRRAMGGREQHSGHRHQEDHDDGRPRQQRLGVCPARHLLQSSLISVRASRCSSSSSSCSWASSCSAGSPRSTSTSNAPSGATRSRSRPRRRCERHSNRWNET